MARQIAPGTPADIKAQQFKVDMPDWSMFDKMGDAKIQAANNNYKLYAEALVTSESNKIYNQFKNDPIQLANALGKIPEMLSNLPPEIQSEMGKKLYLNSVSLVQKAEENQTALYDAENKKNADFTIENTRQNILPSYMNLLQNNIAPAEDKKPVLNDIFLSNVDSLQTLSDLKNSKGLDVYTDAQKKTIRNISDVELDGFKQFVDSMILNDNEDFEKTTAYYQQHVLAPERFMSENYMNRDTYDKARAYLEKQMKQAGADIKNMRFKQSVKEATELQMVDLPGRLQELKESGLIDRKIINQIEKTNVKFNEIDPAKTESPVAMINMLEIINSQRYSSVPTTEDEQQKILEEGTATLDAVAEYAQAYGLSPKNVQGIRETVVNIETNAAFAPVLRNFGDIIEDFESKLETVRKRSTKSGIGASYMNLTNHDGMSNEEAIKIIRLNNLLAQSTDVINQQIRNQDWNGVRQTQKEVQKGAARISYDWIDWDEVDRNPDATFERNGRTVKVKGYTIDGDVIFEIVK